MFLIVHTVVHIALLPYGQVWMDALTDLRLTHSRYPHDWLLDSMLVEALALTFLCDHLGFSQAPTGDGRGVGREGGLVLFQAFRLFRPLEDQNLPLALSRTRTAGEPRRRR